VRKLQKIKAENLTPSARSPVIPQVTDSEKTQAAEELNDKAQKKAEKKVEKLEKAKKEKKPKKDQPSASGSEHSESPFPAEGKVNKYGFIYLSGEILAAFGIHKGAEAKLSITLEGDTLIIRKA
jgi:hypothetical protein